MSESADSNKITVRYWDCFFRDDFQESFLCAEELIINPETREKGLEFKAKVMVKQGLYDEAYDSLLGLQKYSPIKLFLQFLVEGNIQDVINEFRDDIDSLIFKAQCIIIARIYCGEEGIEGAEDPDSILEGVFKKLVDVKEYDRAILSYAQFIELLFREQELAKDIIMPLACEQLDNLISLSKKAKYESTRAKVFLLKAKLLKDKEAAEDAQILFGKDNNQNGLAEVYTFYAVDCGEEEYYLKALEIFKSLGNKNAQGFIYESLASDSLVQGSIQEACQYFEKAEELVKNSGIFEKVGLEIQKLSLHAVKGEFKVLSEKANIFLDSQTDIPKLFRAQAFQILATSLLYTQSDLTLATEYINTACDLFKELKKYNQLLNAKNILFQVLSMGDDLDKILALGEEIIQIANRLERFEDKAAKYVDLAFSIIKVNADKGLLDGDKLDTASDYFEKAIEIHRAQDNIVGEADVYQAMGNMFANVGKLEESFKCLTKAQDLYRQEKALLQASITAILIGLLVGDEAIANETTYPIANEQFQAALEYFEKEALLDLIWKTNFYLAELNERIYLKHKDPAFKNKAKKHYEAMHDSALQYEVNSNAEEINIGATTISEAFAKAEAFYRLIDEPENSSKFFRNNN